MAHVSALLDSQNVIELGKHAVALGDCVEIMRGIPAGSVDAIVTDPPYGLGFMGKAWDALPPGPAWADQCLRVLKPGGHVVAFGGTRTVHRLTVALEDAGFEIRDTIHWCYWSGFPKSLDVSKAIDKQRHDRDEVLQVTGWIKQERDRAGVTNKQIDDAFGFRGMAGHWTSTASQPSVPTLDQVPVLLEVFRLSLDDVPEEIRDLIWTLNGNKGQPGAAWLDRKVLGKHSGDMGGFAGERLGKPGGAITAPATDAAKTWQGWGTALKPALEPAILARKPMTGTVADCVQEHGTGALNIDACRIAPGDKAWPGPGDDGDSRWPANLYHCPKPSTSEREEGTEGRAAYGERGNSHPTVKPIRLMRWLVRLVTPPGGVVLEPFAGSGTTLLAAEIADIGAQCVAIEREPEYVEIIRARFGAREVLRRMLSGPVSQPDRDALAVQISLFGDS
jgi:DNA modification methylase